MLSKTEERVWDCTIVPADNQRSTGNENAFGRAVDVAQVERMCMKGFLRGITLIITVIIKDFTQVEKKKVETAIVKTSRV